MNETAGCHFAALQFYCYSSSNLQIACVLVSRRPLIISATKISDEYYWDHQSLRTLRWELL